MRARLDLRSSGSARLDKAVILGLKQRTQDGAQRGLILNGEDDVHGLCHGACSVVGSVSSKRAPPPGRCCASILPP